MQDYAWFLHTKEPISYIVDLLLVESRGKEGAYYQQPTRNSSCNSLHVSPQMIIQHVDIEWRQLFFQIAHFHQAVAKNCDLQKYIFIRSLEIDYKHAKGKKKIYKIKNNYYQYNKPMSDVLLPPSILVNVLNIMLTKRPQSNSVHNLNWVHGFLFFVFLFLFYFIFSSSSLWI